ncbi:TIGR03915 family putative DNA repair protein [Pseudomonas neustonica]|uniref:TIGR03915 family putative DNA repair protein n=1 Tax=Pseudomonas neustonica TaxID=2487346 RepID=UPI003CBDCFAA|tara:strand:- start:1063 stop:1926 length:864 start_codon:yes stop_codon:yes gene_type:complete
MQVLCCDDDFERWRAQARHLLMQQVAPHAVVWADQVQPQLFANAPNADEQPAMAPALPPPRVSAQLLGELETAAQYRTPGRWNLLYRVLWRVVEGERHAGLAGDADGSELQRRIKAVRREAHHLHAFVRFHPLTDHPWLDYVAWHECAHDVLASASMHFAERLGRQRWLIVSSRDAVWYDGHELHYRRTCPGEWASLAARARDSGDPLWETYYSSIFNPARLNPEVMQGHMPLRFWAGLPEGHLIAGLISRARTGAQKHGQTEALAGKSGKVIRSLQQHSAANRKAP